MNPPDTEEHCDHSMPTAWQNLQLTKSPAGGDAMTRSSATNQR
jgi:hypothetical protein